MYMILEKFERQSFFGESISSAKMTISEADRKQSNLLDVILKFNDKS